MTKVWVMMWDIPYEGENLLGIFDSYQRAFDSMMMHYGKDLTHLDEFRIFELELNKFE